MQWGKGEFESGDWTDGGPGWAKYPHVEAELKPTVANDGIFWVTKAEFFKVSFLLSFKSTSMNCVHSLTVFCCR